MSNSGSTHGVVSDGSRANGRAVADEADRLAATASDLFAPLEVTGWPNSRRVKRFVESEDLGRAIGFYLRAMRLRPDEPSYAWNLSGSLQRLGLATLATAMRSTAVRTAERRGDERFTTADAYLALAEIGLAAEQFEIVRSALSSARATGADEAEIEKLERSLRRRAIVRDHSAPGRPLPNEDSGRKGKAVEHLVAASCILGSELHLNVSTNFVDDEGVDLVFHRRDSSTTLAVQVKSRSWESSLLARQQQFVAQVRAQTFRPRRDLYMLYVAVDARAGTYGPVWLVPSVVLAQRVRPNSKNRFRFAASARTDSRDQWSEFRLERPELPGRLMSILDELEHDGSSVAASAEPLTRAERGVVMLAAAGRTNRDIATSLDLHQKTVERHLQMAYRKLGVRSRRALPEALTSRGVLA